MSGLTTDNELCRENCSLGSPLLTCFLIAQKILWPVACFYKKVSKKDTLKTLEGHKPTGCLGGMKDGLYLLVVLCCLPVLFHRVEIRKTHQV